ncbi:MAG: Ca2+-dependent phosphoinositide-specific phospholipase C [Spirochaetes bacterium]|nr:Ca2+-dependent phosphoinositide-specific phospholipase C [Spirochaetota bacterium]
MRVVRVVLLSVAGLAAVLVLCILAVLVFLLASRGLDGSRQTRRVEALRRLDSAGVENERAARALPDDGSVRLDGIQLVGTHNSYHLRSDALRLFLIGLAQPGEPAKLRYSHAPLSEQFESGVRSIELDVRNRSGRFIISHVPLVDDRTTCPDFRSALEEIRLWSEHTPGHVPIIVLLELKEDWTFLDPRLKPFDRPALDRLDGLIRDVFPPGGLLTPDDVRAGAESLESAILAHGWPLLREARGRVMFILHENDEYRRLFIAGNPTLSGRAMFTCAPPGSPDAGVLILNDPLADGGRIRDLVRRGYLVRTRADADLVIDPAQYRAALDSGAQVVSTDYPPSEPDPVTGYRCAFPGDTTARVRPAD